MFSLMVNDRVRLKGSANVGTVTRIVVHMNPYCFIVGVKFDGENDLCQVSPEWLEKVV